MSTLLYSSGIKGSPPSLIHSFSKLGIFVSQARQRAVLSLRGCAFNAGLGDEKRLSAGSTYSLHRELSSSRGHQYMLTFEPSVMSSTAIAGVAGRSEVAQFIVERVPVKMINYKSALSGALCGPVDGYATLMAGMGSRADRVVKKDSMKRELATWRSERVAWSLYVAVVIDHMSGCYTKTPAGVR